jgi:hypothetical protein
MKREGGRGKYIVNTNPKFFTKKKGLHVGWGNTFLILGGGNNPTCPDSWGGRLMKREYKTPKFEIHDDFRCEFLNDCTIL